MKEVWIWKSFFGNKKVIMWIPPAAQNLTCSSLGWPAVAAQDPPVSAWTFTPFSWLYQALSMMVGRTSLGWRTEKDIDLVHERISEACLCYVGIKKRLFKNNPWRKWLLFKILAFLDFSFFPFFSFSATFLKLVSYFNQTGMTTVILGPVGIQQ